MQGYPACTCTGSNVWGPGGWGGPQTNLWLYPNDSETCVDPYPGQTQELVDSGSVQWIFRWIPADPNNPQDDPPPASATFLVWSEAQVQNDVYDDSPDLVVNKLDDGFGDSPVIPSDNSGATSSGTVLMHASISGTTATVSIPTATIDITVGSGASGGDSVQAAIWNRVTPDTRAVSLHRLGARNETTGPDGDVPVYNKTSALYKGPYMEVVQTERDGRIIGGGCCWGTTLTPPRV